MPRTWNFYCHTDVHRCHTDGIMKRLESKTVLCHEWENIKAAHQIQSPLLLSTSLQSGFSVFLINGKRTEAAAARRY